MGNQPEPAVAEIWAAQLLPDVGHIDEGRRRLSAIIADGERRNFKILLPAAYYWLGMGAYLQNEISEHNRVLVSALQIAEASHNAFAIQHVEDSLTVNFSDLGEFERALENASKMLFRRDLYYQNPRQYWREKGTLSELTLKLGFSSTALALAQEDLDILLDQTKDRKPETSGSMLTDSLRTVTDAAVARREFPLALRQTGEALALALAREGGDENARSIAEIYWQRAEVESGAKDWGTALGDYDRALELLRRLPEVKADLYRNHKGKLFCLQNLGRTTEFESELKIVLDLSEQYRNTIRDDDARQAFFANEQDVFDAAVSHALASQDTEGAFDLVETSKARSLLDFVASKNSITEVEKSFGPVVRPLTQRELRSRLPEPVQLIQYAVLPDRFIVWTITRSGVQWKELRLPAAELAQKIESYRTAVLAQASPAELQVAARELYDLLIPANLDPAKQVCIVADGVLHRLPFAALVSPTGKFLVEEYALSYAPSASVLVVASDNAAKRKTTADESILAFGNPEFDRSDEPNLPELPSAEDEVRTVAQRYRRPQVFVSAAATKAQFVDHFADFEVIHFAGHFVVNSSSPRNSKLLFAGGVVRSADLAAYKLPRAKLVVLSACETGFERFNKSEGAIGAARSFLALGAPLVLASQWKVDSEPTKDLMIAFHRQRKEAGLTAAESLRRAQLEMLRRDATSAPFFWAAFTLFGGYTNY